MDLYQLAIIPPVSPSPSSTVPVPTTPLDSMDNDFVLTAAAAGIGSDSERCDERGGGGGGATATAAFRQTQCAVKTCKQLIVKQPSRPGVITFVMFIFLSQLVTTYA